MYARYAMQQRNPVYTFDTSCSVDAGLITCESAITFEKFIHINCSRRDWRKNKQRQHVASRIVFIGILNLKSWSKTLFIDGVRFTIILYVC